MKQNLSLSQTQRLNLTPQLQQAIRLLQLNAVELHQEIEHFLESNPLLVRDEANEDYGSSSSKDLSAHESIESRETPAPESVETIPDELSLDVTWQMIDEDWGGSAQRPVQEIPWQNIRQNSDSFVDHLLEQVKECGGSGADDEVIIQLVHCLDEKGFLSESDEELSEIVRIDGLPVSTREILLARQALNQMEPTGFGARDAIDFCFLQLCDLSERPGLLEALLLVKEGLSGDAVVNIRQIKAQTELEKDEIELGLNLLSLLYRYPAQALNLGVEDYIVPEVLVAQEGEQFVAKLNEDVVPNLGINPFYKRMIKTIRMKDDAKYIRQQLSQAQDLIKNINNRFHTLLRVSNAIIHYQQAFFQEGQKAMKPLTLQSIAEELELHESTVSRATAGKFMATPYGVYELKFFFSSHIGTQNGLDVSSTAIKSFIEEIVAKEDPRKPVSDQKICDHLGEQHGLKIARRTVAKYREALQIPSSSLRKKRI
ncbi:MAG: RNA polymerase factor sigma-54 [Pseudomonadota bacterium]|nr:RNA polymerase factor sigma-54 [Pseudomonadota bacterium]